MSHLIIGAADGYSWKDIRVWAESLRSTGFTGDVVLIAYRIGDDVVPNCKRLNIKVVAPESDETGMPINYNSGLPTPSHKLRNFHMYQFLKDASSVYDVVAVNDVRDIYYQKNPDSFFNSVTEDIYLPSENVLFKHEPWNKEMVHHLFGPYITFELNDLPTCNSGTFFGRQKHMERALLNMYLLARSFNRTGADQPALNVYGYLMSFAKLLTMNSAYACQCGTTLDPTKSFEQVEPMPIIGDDGIVRTSLGNTFILIHQYDRVPQLKTVIESRFV